MQCEFRVPWTPGKIEAIAYRKGKEIARTSQATAGTPAKIDIDIENKNLKADCQDISIISISQKDNNGILYPYGENRIHANIKGDARILSLKAVTLLIQKQTSLQNQKDVSLDLTGFSSSLQVIMKIRPLHYILDVYQAIRNYGLQTKFQFYMKASH